MNHQDLITKLNWFYTLELNQVDWYLSQHAGFPGSYESLVFQRTSLIEQEHVDNIAAQIKKLQGTPTKIGDVLSPILGRVAGSLLSISGIKNVLKANILIEQKAMNDYTELINTIQDDFGPELKRVLQFNMVDEDTHTAWFAMRLSDYDNSVLTDL